MFSGVGQYLVKALRANLPCNVPPVRLQNSTKAWPQGRNTDFSSKLGRHRCRRYKWHGPDAHKLAKIC